MLPVIDQVPSPLGSALVRSAPTSEPASGSDRFIVPVHSPETSLARYVSVTYSSATELMAWIEPWVNSGAIENAMLELTMNSCSAMPTASGNPPPP